MKKFKDYTPEEIVKFNELQASNWNDYIENLKQQFAKGEGDVARMSKKEFYEHLDMLMPMPFELLKLREYTSSPAYKRKMAAIEKRLIRAEKKSARLEAKSGRLETECVFRDELRSIAIREGIKVN